MLITKKHKEVHPIMYFLMVIIIVINAGTATSNFFQFISAKLAAIKIPTTTNAGSYIESTSGVAVGARTGFASIVTGICFLLALFFSPNNSS
jgi:xanthine/uracil/vitamin C permease (AzgA family)